MFESLTAVLLLIVFLVPGYIWSTVEGLLVKQDKKSEWEVFALELLTRSTILYLPTFALHYLNWKAGWFEIHPWRTGAVALLQVIIAPLGAGFLTGIARQKEWLPKLIVRFKLRPFTPISSAWEDRFKGISECWVIVSLKNGQQVNGFFGHGSLVSSDPENRDIFISQAVVSDETGFRLVENTDGVYIAASEIQTIEFFKKTS